jgi:hypothetical protein
MARFSDEPLRHLILSVILLCERTRDLARSELRGPFALEPLRDAIDVLLRSMDGVAQSDLDPVVLSLDDDPDGDEMWLVEID